MFDEMPDSCKDFFSYLNISKNLSKNTIKEYYYDLRIFFKYLKTKKLKLNNEFTETEIFDIDLNFIQNIDERDLKDYLTYISIFKNSNAITRSRKIATIKSFFKYLLREKKITTNPTLLLEFPKLPKRLPKYLTLNESIDLLSVIDGDNKDRDYAIITIFLNCGLRLSELVGINLNSINASKLSVTGKGNKEREIHLNNSCLNAISRYIPIRNMHTNIVDKNALFISKQGKRMSPRTVEIMVKNYVTKAGLNPNKITPHKLRHTAATLMHKHGNVDIRALQQILGHESIATTEIYTHIDSEQITSAMDSNPLNNIERNL